MLINTFRNFFVLIVAIYSFYKLLNFDFFTKRIFLRSIISSFIISLVASFLFLDALSLNWLFILLLFFILLKFTTKLNSSILYTTSLFSFSLSFIALNLSFIIISIALSPFYYGKYDIPWFFIHICIWVVQCILIFCCFRIPRLKKGMIFLYNTPSNNIATSFCLFTIMLFILITQAKTHNEVIILSFSTILFFVGFLLIYWWNYHITQTYRRFLRKNELDSLNLLLEEKNQEIIYLKSENDKLGRIIHKDNKIIPALSMAIIDSYENRTELDLSELEAYSPLYVKLKQLYVERNETLEKYQQEILHLPQTAFDSVNAILSYMQSEALNAGIPYQVVLFDRLDSTIPSEIIMDDFNHLLSDLLANAINACKNMPSASVQVYLGKMEGISTIKICNTGNIFDIETLKNLGITRHTTHADTGGSGIGLMDIWKIKQKYAATLLIDENIGSDSPFTHTYVNILFNHKNHYMIQSNRHKELTTYINRPDIMIMSKD